MCVRLVFQEFAHEVIIPVTRRTMCHQHGNQNLRCRSALEFNNIWSWPQWR